jgi:hypothetical protein
LCSDSFIESLFERLNGRQRIVFLAVSRGLRLSNRYTVRQPIVLSTRRRPSLQNSLRVPSFRR